MQSEFRIIPIANDTICALYCGDSRLPHSVIGAVPSLSSEEIEKLSPPPFPSYRTTFPGYVMFGYNMHYSEASLEDLAQVQLCMDAGYCIGILLHYKTYRKTVGQFRYDKEVSDFLKPCSFRLVQEQHETKPRIRIQHFDERSTEITRSLHLRLTKGNMVWWYSKDVSVVTLFSHDGFDF
jgi:hypothetical protein